MTRNYEEPIGICSRSWWIKIVEMLQQNWALIEVGPSNVTVYFISDTGGVFDQMEFSNEEDAGIALVRNGFSLYELDEEMKKFHRTPEPPFYMRDHPNGPIYSSGRYWK